GSSAFSVSPNAFNVATGDSGKDKVYFNSTAVGLDSALVLLATNDPLNQVITIKVKGIGSTTGVQDAPPLLVPEAFVLEQNYPNPFNPSTTISYQLPKESNVELRIYSVLGEAVRTLLSETQAAGYKSVVWDGRGDAGLSVSSGIYFYRLKAGEFVQVRKMLLAK
ncbi:MAG: T9SS type A sorting domain-containing protein, partial [Ignavibacteriales bacterium]|nr:T9SS type A sorting domain-containing protein [Ignavibacteriales bacterium]